MEAGSTTIPLSAFYLLTNRPLHEYLLVFLRLICVSSVHLCPLVLLSLTFKWLSLSILSIPVNLLYDAIILYEGICYFIVNI